jgi:hypothetical protein
MGHRPAGAGALYLGQMNLLLAIPLGELTLALARGNERHGGL